MGKWKQVAKVVTYPIAHPVQSGRAVVGAGKTALVAGATGYVGWEMLTTDKSAARVVSEAVIGEGSTDAIAHTVHGASDLIESTEEKIDQATTAIGSAGQGLNGISNFLGNAFGGNGGNMFSNFFGNLTSGNVSGMSIVGLVGAAMLIFGRTGWFGKIAGGLLAMLLIGNNASRQQNNGQQATSSYSRASVYSPENDPGKVFVKAWDAGGRELPAIEMDAQRYQEMVAKKMTPMQIYSQLSALSSSEQVEQERQTVIGR